MHQRYRRRPDDMYPSNWSISYQSAMFGIVPPRIYRRDRVACRQLDELDAPASEKRAGRTISSTSGCSPHKTREGRIDLAACAGVKHLDLQSHGATSRFCVFDVTSVIPVAQFDQHGNASRSGHQFAQEFEVALPSTHSRKIDTGCVAGWPGQARDKTNPDWVFAGDENDRDRRGCRLGRECPGW